MRLSVFILHLLQFIVDMLLMSCRHYEQSGNLDSDGVPMDEEWQLQSFLLPLLRDTISSFEQALKNEK